MAEIPIYRASKGLQSPGIPDSRLISPDGAALADVGQAISGAAEMFQQRNEQRENFTAENARRKFDLDVSQGMIDAEQNAPVDGAGFHDGFLENVYRPKRDEFLSKLPPRLRSKYAEMYNDDTGSASAEWSYKAANKERDIASTWVKNELGVSQDQLANAIGQDPAAYDRFYDEGVKGIEDAPFMSPMEKQVAKQSWDNFAKTAYLNRLMEDDPQLVLRYLNANPNKLSPATQFDVLSRAVQAQETGNAPNRVSPAGAVGAMQVMPGTARDIAKEIGDENFPTGGDPQQVTEYLLRPGISKKYGDYYLKKMMKMFPNDMEAALIAYNGGPARAQEWIKAGRDDSVLPAETAKYYKQVQARMPGLTAPGAAKNRTAYAGNVSFVNSHTGEAQSFEHVNTELTSRVSAAFGAVGIGKVKVNSAYRDPVHNAAVGGVKKSQHIHGNAMDIDVSGYSNAQRVEIIRSLSANGITGIGVGSNIIHADVGGRRVWGYPNPPPWANAVLAEHMKGGAAPSTKGGASDFNSLAYDKRQAFINKADQELSSRLTAAQKVTDVAKVETRSAMTNELATIAATGQPSGKFDETEIATVLGEDDYLTYAAKRAEAVKTYGATEGIKTMSPDEMQTQIDAYDPDPNSDTFASDQKVQAAVVKEVERVTKLRAQAPDKAAMLFPEVAQSVSVAVQGVNEGKPDPAAIQKMTALLLERQKQFGIPEKAMAPMPREWAFEMGRVLATKVPTRGKDVSAEEVRAAIAAQYSAAQQLFGDFADEAIVYALSVYKGVPKQTADQIVGLMGAIAAGGDPFHQKKGSDAGEVEKLAEPSFFSYDYWFGKSAPEDDEAAVEEQLSTEGAGPAPPSAERVSRARRALDEAETPEEEAAIVSKYGQQAVDAAKLQGEQTE